MQRARPQLSPSSSLGLWWCLFSLWASGCAHPRAISPLPTSMLLLADDRPSLFLGPEPTAPQVGYVSPDAVLELTGPPTQGRVPVRIDGPLRTRGYVGEEQLRLRVQRRGRVRGTPVYVGPGDFVRVLGSDADPSRLRVRVAPKLGPFELGSYEGSYPCAGLAAGGAPRSAELPEPGTRYQVAAQTALPLFEAPRGAQVAKLLPQPEPYEVSVVRAVDGWHAVRVGTGPYLIGWTDAPIAPIAHEAPPIASVANTVSASVPEAVPTRIAREPGELKRVAAGAQVLFGTRVIGVFQSAGFARVVAVYQGGFADVFAAADDGVALRGLVRLSDLSETSKRAEAHSPVLAPSPADASR